MAFDQQTVTEYAKQHGAYAMDIWTAREFSRVSGRDETEVLAILRRGTDENLKDEHGTGKYSRAVEGACTDLAFGWEHAASYDIPAPALIASRRIVVAYAILAWQHSQRPVEVAC